MKTMIRIASRAFALLALALTTALPAHAQLTDNGYASIDWQYNFPISNDFTDGSSGWGMALEGGRYLTDNYALGLFANFHSNHEYVPRRTLSMGDNGSLNTDQQRTTFQLPFGVASRYTWNRGGNCQPYFGSKLGAEYAKLRSAFNTYEANNDTWGFYVSTELGVSFYPGAYGPGLHLAAYYSYSTNKGDLMGGSVDGLHNVGLRLGIAF